jgi:hypothetical protein
MSVVTEPTGAAAGLSLVVISVAACAWLWRDAFRYVLRVHASRWKAHIVGLLGGALGMMLGVLFTVGVMGPGIFGLAVFSALSFALVSFVLRKTPDKAPAHAPVQPVVAQVPTDQTQTLYAPIDHERVRRDVEARRDAEAQRALDAVRLPPPPYPYSAPAPAPAKAPRKRAPAKPVPRIDPIVLPDRVEFDYQKADGTISHRIVKVNQVDAPGGRFTGFCETSWAVKTFKIDGVLDTVTRHETGEIMPAMDWYQALKPAASKRSKK